jgi:hypothetical protein
MNTKICVRRVGVLSLAKISGALYGLIGLILGAIFSLASIMASALMQSATNGNSRAAFGVLFGAGAIILLPILYGVIGFVSGLITGVLYNALAGVVGGVELEWVQTQA